MLGKEGVEKTIVVVSGADNHLGFGNNGYNSEIRLEDNTTPFNNNLIDYVGYGGGGGGCLHIICWS